MLMIFDAHIRCCCRSFPVKIDNNALPPESLEGAKEYGTHAHSYTSPSPVGEKNNFLIAVAKRFPLKCCGVPTAAPAQVGHKTTTVLLLLIVYLSRAYTGRGCVADRCIHRAPSCRVVGYITRVRPAS